jgi:hypothetical protein
MTIIEREELHLCHSERWAVVMMIDSIMRRPVVSFCYAIKLSMPVVCY